MTVFAKADEVSELLNCGKSTAYKMTISGNVNRAYLFERMGIKAESEVLEDGK